MHLILVTVYLSCTIGKYIYWLLNDMHAERGFSAGDILLASALVYFLNKRKNENDTERTRNLSKTMIILTLKSAAPVILWYAFALLYRISANE